MYSDNDRYNSYYDPNFVIFEILVEYLSSQMYLTLVENCTFDIVQGWGPI